MLANSTQRVCTRHGGCTTTDDAPVNVVRTLDELVHGHHLRSVALFRRLQAARCVAMQPTHARSALSRVNREHHAALTRCPSSTAGGNGRVTVNLFGAHQHVLICAPHAAGQFTTCLSRAVACNEVEGANVCATRQARSHALQGVEWARETRRGVSWTRFRPGRRADSGPDTK